MLNHLKKSLLLLIFFGISFSLPIVAVGYSVHGPDLALIAAVAVVCLVFMGPLSFIFASSIATDLELTLITAFGALMFFSWIKALSMPSGYPFPYFPVTCWALMGAYFCISLYFAHATA